MENNQFFPEIKGRFGFGCMRLPLTKDGNDVDTQQFKQMVDSFIGAGFNYFDTAHNYDLGKNGKSESALKNCLTSRHPRNSYVLANKITFGLFHCEEELEGLLNQQLNACGVEYFDFLMMHSVTENSYNDHYKKYNVYQFLHRMRDKQKAHHIGFSFHDSPEVLEQVLTECPDVEFVQLQFNYLDYNDKIFRSGECYNICKRHHIPVIVMEPVKGGNLSIKIPTEANEALNALSPRWSNASYALRFAASFENVMMVLSGMSTMEQMQENLQTMNPPQPLSSEEMMALQESAEIIRKLNPIGCTSCRYCVKGCPQKIPIPEILELYNKTLLFPEDNNAFYYLNKTLGRENTSSKKASDCISCGACKKRCPQKLDIPDLLKKADAALNITE